MRVGFTGTREGMNRLQLQSLHWFFRSHVVMELHHGDCIGADKQAWALARQKHVATICHPPKSPRFRAFTSNNSVTFEPLEYLVRNKRIVSDTEALIAAPKELYEILKSGTWSTVRFARQKNRPIYLLLRDGRVEREN